MPTSVPEIRVVQGSLTDGDETILVNASNTQADLGSGVSAAIRAACGPRFQADIHAALAKVYGGPMAPGDVLLTHAGTHPRAKFVAHAAVMDYRGGAGASAMPDRDRIERCLVNVWNAIESIPGQDALSVALPALGAGTGRLGVRIPTELACTTLRAHLEARSSRIARVTFYGYMLNEWIAVLAVVSKQFELPPGSIPDEVRGLLD